MANSKINRKSDKEQRQKYIFTQGCDETPVGGCLGQDSSESSWPVLVDKSNTFIVTKAVTRSIFNFFADWLRSTRFPPTNRWLLGGYCRSV